MEWAGGRGGTCRTTEYIPKISGAETKTAVLKLSASWMAPSGGRTTEMIMLASRFSAESTVARLSPVMSMLSSVWN